MLYSVTPEQKVGGVPPLVVLERSGQLNGVDGLGGRWDFLKEMLPGAVNTFQGIAKSRWSVPQIPEGTMIQKTDAGDVLLRQPRGYPVGQPPVGSIGGRFDTGLGGGVMIAAVAGLIAVVMIAKKR